MKIVDRVDVGIMYQIMEKFKTFFYSLKVINDLYHKIERAISEITDIKSKQNHELRVIMNYPSKIAKRAKIVENMKRYRDILVKRSSMKNMNDKIKYYLDAQDYREALVFYLDLKRSIDDNEDKNASRFYRDYFNHLSRNLSEYLKNSFQNQFFNYFYSPFDYTSDIFNDILDTNVLERSAIFRSDSSSFKNFNTNITDKDDDTIQKISNLLVVLTSISNVGFKNFQGKLLEFYSIYNNKLSTDIYSHISKFFSQNVMSLKIYCNAISIFQNIQYNALMKFFDVLQKVFDDAFNDYFINIESVDGILASRHFIMIENFYAIYMVVLQKHSVYFADFVKGLSLEMLKDISVYEIKEFMLLIQKIRREMFSDIYRRFEASGSYSDDKLKLYNKIAKQAGINLSTQNYALMFQKIEKSVIDVFFSKNSEALKKKVHYETWQKSNISYDLKEAVKNILLKQGSQRSIESSNAVLYIDNRTYFITNSLAFFITTIDNYVRLIDDTEFHKRLLTTYIHQTFNLYNEITLYIIIRGGCLNFQVIKKIDENLLIFLKKELEMVLIIFNALVEKEIIINSDSIAQLRTDIDKHQDLLMANMFSMIKEQIEVKTDKLSYYNWRDPTFKFLSPSVETCYLINYLSKVFKDIEPFMQSAELDELFESVYQIIIEFYIYSLNDISRVSPHNASGISEEKKFLVKQLDELKANLRKQKNTT